MTPQEQMSDDIKKWAAEKLAQWFDDSMMRYKLIGLSRRDAEAEVMSILMITAVGTLATRTHAPILDISVKIGEMIATIRHSEGLDINLIDKNDNQ
jgi:hypothetical protein